MLPCFQDRRLLLRDLLHAPDEVAATNAIRYQRQHREWARYDIGDVIEKLKEESDQVVALSCARWPDGRSD